MFGVLAKLPLRQQDDRREQGVQAEPMCPTERDQVLCLAFVEPAPRHRDTHGQSRFDVSGGSPGWRQVVGEHRGHEPLESRPLLLVYAPFGEHNL